MYLIKETKTYRCESEQEAADKIEKVKNLANTEGYTVKKTVVTEKTKKSKGEIVELFYLCDITIAYGE